MSGQQRADGALTIEGALEDGRYRVRVIGELDMSCVAGFDVALLAAEESSAPCIVLDITKLEFIDSAGLGAIVRAQRRNAAAGRLLVTRPRGHVADMLRLTAIDQTLTFL